MDLLSTNILLAITAMFHVLMAIIASRSPRRKDQKYTIVFFFLLSFSFALWVISNIFIDISSSKFAAITWTKLSGIALVTLAPSFTYLALSFPNQRPPRNVILNIAHIAIYVSLMVLLIFTNTVVRDLDMDSFPRSVSYSWAYPFVTAYVFLNLAISVYVFFRKSTRSKPEHALQARYLVIGLLGTAFLALFSNLLLPLIGITDFTRIGPISTLLFSLAVATAILKYRLFSLKLILSTLIKYTILGLWSLIVFTSVVLLHSYIWDEILSAPSLIIGLWWGILFAWSFSHIERIVSQKIISHIIDFDKEKTLKSLRSAVELEIRRDKILQKLFTIVHDTFKTSDIIYLPEDGSTVMGLSESGKREAAIQEIKDLESLSNIRPNIPLECDNTKLPPNFRHYCEQNKIKIIVRLKGIRENVGYILIKGKTTFHPYYQEEVDVIAELSYITGVSLERALLYQEVQDFNITLQQKVDTATAELKTRNKELEDLYNNLEELYQKEKDLMDVAGHEFRTPASILKNNLYLLKRRLEELSPQNLKDEKIEKYLKRLIEGTDRQIKLVNTFLESARIDNQRFEIQVEMKNIVDVVGEAVSDAKQFAKEKGLRLMYDPPQKKIHVEVDLVRIREVIDNLINNAIKYTHKGYIEISLKENTESVTISIRDTGVGIKKEDQALLFKKFSRVENYIGGEEGSIVRPGGTGLGLYVAKTIVDAHGGEITVDSDIGKGSTFNISLPKTQPSYVRRVEGAKSKLLFNSSITSQLKTENPRKD